MRSVLLAVMLAALPAAADDAKPWAAGVNESEQQAALALYREGNSEFVESRYPQALAKYREAMKHWNHPGIQFNAAVCLVNLDQPVEAITFLEAALKYGEAALGAEVYAQGLTYMKLLQGQISKLTVTCDSDGADVTLDGQKLFTCPGSTKRVLVPGEHQLVTFKPGFLTETSKLMLLPGRELVHAVKLTSLTSVRTKVVRRWNARTPWVVTGIGLGVAALGGLSLFLAKSEADTYDALVLEQCPMGCGPTMMPGMQEVAEGTRAHETRGTIFNVAGIGLVTVGAAAIIGGLVGVYLNQPRTVADTSAPIVTPTIGTTGAGASMQWSF